MLRITEIQFPADNGLFRAVAQKLYANDLNYIIPLDKDIDEVFDPRKNKLFAEGAQVKRWIVQNETNEPVGRIAAFINPKYKNKNDTSLVGGVGFFESIDNLAVSKLLFDTAKNWLQTQGAVAMDGPINFGERDRWWGLVVSGFTEPLYGMNYNPPYYKNLFEDYGFEPFYNQICFGLLPKQPLHPIIWHRYHKISEDKNYSAAHIKKSNLKKAVSDFATVYNAAWAGHDGLKELSISEVQKLFKQMRPVIDEKIIWFAYYKNEPIAMYVNLPDLNQWFQYVKGKFGLLQKLKFLWVKATKPNKRFVGLVFGVVPAFQGKGIDAYIIAAAANYVQSKESPYSQYEMQWIGDFNPKMINVAKKLGDTFENRRLTTYRYNFDTTLPFERHPML